MKKILVATAAFALLGASAALAQQDQGERHYRGEGQAQGQGQGHGQGGGQGQGGQGQGQGQRYQGQAQGQVYQGQRFQGQAQAQGQRPDWNAYFRNNPDLQRDYQHNRQNPAYNESPEAYAQRHYEQHGRAEGRQLPMAQGGQWQGNGQYQGNGQWQGRQYQGQNNQWRNGQQWQGGGDRRDFRGGDRDRADRRDWNRYQRNTNAERRFRLGSYERPRGFYYRRWSFGEFLPALFWTQNYWLYDYGDYGLPYPPPGCVWVRYGDDALLIDQYTGEIVEVIYGLFY
jgi:Ni/Co efflux regulator RcnB